jgi:hypothetical protein
MQGSAHAVGYDILLTSLCLLLCTLDLAEDLLEEQAYVNEPLRIKIYTRRRDRLPA